MSVQKAIIERRSVRSFSTKQISDELIMQVLEAGRWAPSADNKQPWEFIVVKNPQIRKKLSNISFWGRFLAQAPVAIAVITNPMTSHTHIIDGTCATQNMMLTAFELGLGTCWIADLNNDETKQILNVPKDLYVITVTPLGFPDAVPSKSKRMELRDLIHRDHYDS
ncbi:5,6-dimethylbenzimidazole synthase [subsurface metagenome]